MRSRSFIPFGVYLSKFDRREEALAMTIIPPKYLVPTPAEPRKNPMANPCHGRPNLPSGTSASCLKHAYSTTQAPTLQKYAREKHLFGQLDPKPITIGKEIDVLPPKKGETLVDVATTKDGDVA